MGLRSLIFVCVLVSGVPSFAQDSTVSIIVDAGLHFIGCEPVNKPYLRADGRRTSLFDGRIKNELTIAYAGAKLEKKTSNQKFGFLAGIRFTSVSNAIVKRGVRGYFFLLHRETGTTTEYLRVREVSEHSQYLGVPLEIRMYLRTGSAWRWYVMAGGDWNYKLAGSGDTDFFDPSMHIHNSSVQEIVGKSGASFASSYFGAGLMLGRNQRRFTIAMTVSGPVSKAVSSLGVPAGGGGLQLTYLLSPKNKGI